MLEPNQSANVFFVTVGTSPWPALTLCWASAHRGTHEIFFSCLQAGQTRGAEERFSGRMQCPKYRPYGLSKMADVAEHGRARQAEVSGGYALSPGSAPPAHPDSFLPQCPLLPRKASPAPSWKTGATGGPDFEISL